MILTLLQARESIMSFVRPLLNQHNLTEQQWRVISILQNKGEMESHQLASQACILRPSMTGVLARMERDGFVKRWRSKQDQRRVHVDLTESGKACFISISDDMEKSFAQLRAIYGEEKLDQLMSLLHDLTLVRRSSSQNND